MINDLPKPILKLCKVLKEKKGVPTVIEVNGLRYVLDLKGGKK